MRAAQQGVNHHNARKHGGHRDLDARAGKQDQRHRTHGINQRPGAFADQHHGKQIPKDHHRLWPRFGGRRAHHNGRRQHAHQRKKRDPQPVRQEHHRSVTTLPDGLKEIMLEKAVDPHIHLRRHLAFDQHWHRINQPGQDQRHQDRADAFGRAKIAAGQKERQQGNGLIGYRGHRVVNTHPLN